jgi:hypothetical protein
VNSAYKKLVAAIVIGCVLLPIMFVCAVLMAAWLIPDAIVTLLVLPFVSRFLAYFVCALILIELFERYRLIKSIVSAVLLVELFTLFSVGDYLLQSSTNAVKSACGAAQFPLFSDLVPCVQSAFLMFVLYQIKFWLLPLIVISVLLTLCGKLKERQKAR